MLGKNTRIIFVALMAFFLVTGFGFKDLVDNVAPDTDKCESQSKVGKCKDLERVKTVAKVVAIGIAAKIAYDMVVEYTSIGVKGDHEIVEIYLEDNKKLPKEPKLISYSANLLPSNIVEVGKPVTVKTSLSVIPGRDSRKVKIEEVIQIFDNEDDEKVIKSLTKVVNGDTDKGGAFDNEFSFTLPEGMPQGVYPVRTVVLVNGEEQEPTTQDMQIVLNVYEGSRFQVAYLAK